jgi:tripartite ATP-independent transporter DctM subunit
MVPVMLISMALGLPFFAAMGTVGLIYGVATYGLDVLPIAGIKVYGFMMEPAFIAVPMFVLMGSQLAATGLAEQLFMAVYKFFGRVRGGLLVAVGVVCTIMAACTGTSAGPIATMAIAALPTMLKKHYNPELACGTISACGCLGTLIPPSSMMIILGITTEIPIGRLYASAFIPGFGLAAIYIAYCLIRAWLVPWDAPGMTKEELGEVHFLQSLWEVTRSIAPVMLVIFAVLGTIYLGVCTATEGAGIGAITTLALSILYRKFTLKNYVSAITVCYRTTAMTCGLMIGSNFFSSVFLSMGGGDAITTLAQRLGISGTGIIYLVLGLNFILGFFMGSTSIILILLPIFWPVLKKMGVPDLWFMMLFIFMTQVGYLTPPYAQGIYLLRPLAPKEIETKTLYRGVIPFICLQFAATIVLWFVHPLTEWLPSLMTK